jgi:hypothetical protein
MSSGKGVRRLCGSGGERVKPDPSPLPMSLSQIFWKKRINVMAAQAKPSSSDSGKARFASSLRPAHFTP